MRDTTEVREQDYKGCRIQVTVVGNATQWNWKGQITFPEGRIDPYLLQYPPLPSSKGAAFNAGFKCGEARIDNWLSNQRQA